MPGWLAQTWPFLWAFRRGYRAGQRVQGALDCFRRDDKARLLAATDRVSQLVDDNAGLQDLTEACQELVRVRRDIL